MLLDVPCSAMVALCLTTLICRAVCYGEDIDMQYVWRSACDLVLMWWILVLSAFLPAIIHVDKRQWVWPLRKNRPLSGRGGPPRNSWPREARFGYRQ